jgi:hypothetical protein
VGGGLLGCLQQLSDANAEWGQRAWPMQEIGGGPMHVGEVECEGCEWRCGGLLSNLVNCSSASFAWTRIGDPQEMAFIGAGGGLAAHGSCGKGMGCRPSSGQLPLGARWPCHPSLVTRRGGASRCLQFFLLQTGPCHCNHGPCETTWVGLSTTELN